MDDMGRVKRKSAFEYAHFCTDSDAQSVFLAFALHCSVVSNDSESGQWRPWADCAKSTEKVFEH